MKSNLTTLCYIEKQGFCLMLHRTAEKDDVNRNKWIGVGGHFEAGESPEDCLLREVKEETGLTLTSYRFRGMITFVYDTQPAEYMCLYTADAFTGTLIPCDEGELEWVAVEKIPALNVWEGDRVFLRMLAEQRPFFSLKLVYRNDMLVSRILDGVPI